MISQSGRRNHKRAGSGRAIELWRHGIFNKLIAVTTCDEIMEWRSKGTCIFFFWHLA